MNCLVLTSVCLSVLLVVGSSPGSPAAEPLVPVQDGEAKATILLARAPGIVTQLAACELQHYIKKISGATVPIVREPAEVKGTVILVGASNATKALGLKNEDFEQREYLLETRPGVLILMGRDASKGGELDYKGDLSAFSSLWHKPLGSCYAVHTFLEKCLGVRWYLPTEIGEVVPKRKTIEVPAIKIRRMTQASEYTRQYAINKQLYVHDYTQGGPQGMTLTALDYDRDYDLRSGMLYWIRNKRCGCEPLSANHSFVGWDKAFGKDHPEWFSTNSWAKMQEIIKDPWGYQKKINPVLSNEGVFRKKVEIIRAYFDGNPAPFPGAYRTAGGKTFGIALNDNGNWSQAPECVKQYEPQMGGRGTVSRYFWNFVNGVAREVGKTHPEAEIISLAYSGYTLPPKEPFRLEPNVGVILCRFPIVYWDRDYKKYDYGQIETWIRYGAKHIYTWEYLVHPEVQNDFPAVLPRTYADDGKWLLSHPQYKGGYMQMYNWGIVSKDGKRRSIVWENPQFHFFNFYFRLKLYDDPSLNVQDMLNEFYDRFYGPAAEPARKFVKAMEDRWNDRQMRKASGFGRASHHLPEKFYWEHMGNAQFIEKLKRMMADVRAAAPEGSIYAKRVELLDKAILGHALFKRQKYLKSLETTTGSRQ